MTILNSTFGFIDYYIGNKRTRIACQFFQSGKSMRARLNGCGTSPVITAVSVWMRPEILGSFQTVLSRYQTEIPMVVAADEFWRECLAEGCGALMLFQVAHNMRLYGTSVIEGINAASKLTCDLWESESASVSSMSQFFIASPNQYEASARSEHLPVNDRKLSIYCPEHIS